jgi:hypothetical protein
MLIQHQSSNSREYISRLAFASRGSTVMRLMRPKEKKSRQALLINSQLLQFNGTDRDHICGQVTPAARHNYQIEKAVAKGSNVLAVVPQPLHQTRQILTNAEECLVCGLIRAMQGLSGGHILVSYEWPSRACEARFSRVAQMATDSFRSK